MYRVLAYCISLFFIATPLLTGCQPVMPAAAAPAPREIPVIAGAGQDVVAINAYFPTSTHIRAGDTVTWKIGSDEPHSVTFLSGAPLPPEPIPVPGGGPTDVMLNPELGTPTRAPDAPVETYDGTGFRNSGHLSNGKSAPPLESYSLTFEQPGIYTYLCNIHPDTMTGVIVVEPANSPNVPSLAEIDAQAQAEVEPMLAAAEEIRAKGLDPSLVTQQPGPNGTTFWYVPAGMGGVDPRVQVYDFFPKDLTVKPGDTVIWTSTFFHQVIFHPGEPPPDFILPTEHESGAMLPVVNPVVAFPAAPAGEYDGTATFSSGLIGVRGGGLPGGTTFALTFPEPGIYDYVCSTHRLLGMTANINVVAQ